MIKTAQYESSSDDFQHFLHNNNNHHTIQLSEEIIDTREHARERLVAKPSLHGEYNDDALQHEEIEVPSIDEKHFEKLALKNIGMNYYHDDEGENTHDEAHSTDGESVMTCSTTIEQYTYTETETFNEKNQSMEKRRHYYPKHRVTKEERMQYCLKVAKTLFTIFMVVFMTTLAVLDIIVSSKNTWVQRLYIFVTFVIFWRFMYEYCFEIILEWVLDYVITEHIITSHSQE